MDLSEAATVAGTIVGSGLLAWFGRPHVDRFRYRNGKDRRASHPPVAPCAFTDGSLPESIQTLVTKMSDFMDELSVHMKTEGESQRAHLKATERVLHVARATAKKVGVEGWTLIESGDGQP